MKVYAGVGGRKAPRHILELCEAAAGLFAAEGWTLRSGHAPGSDQAFEWGARHGAAEIYLPWPGYERQTPVRATYRQDRAIPEAYTLAARVHPAWRDLPSSVRALHARNAHQVLGADLLSPAAFVLCWTIGGRTTGGTATAIRLAEEWGVPVFNLAMASARDRIEAKVAQATRLL